MIKISHRTRWAGATSAIAIGLLSAAACGHFNESLLEPQNPGLVDATAVGSPAASKALYVGAIGRWKLLLNCSGGECLWPESGHLADEYKNADFQPSRQDVDQRTMAIDADPFGYGTVTQIRGFVRQAIVAEQTYEPAKTANIGELYMALGFVEMQLAESYCNGIPLGHTDNGNVVLGPPLTNSQVYDSASAHLDTALAMTASGSDPGNAFIHQAALIVKARILINKGQYATAAALVSTAAVPSTYQYIWTTSTASNSDDNGNWIINWSVSRLTVADSFDIINGQVNVIKNNLPFASANDPRVPVVTGASQKLVSEDGTTPLFLEAVWKARDDPIPVASGIDARLMEAEAKLNASDFAGMMTILNALRTAPPKIGNFQPTTMAAIATTPATKDAATTLFFREKGFWTFGRGQRLGDLRRLIRQYGRTQDNVFPSGNYYKGGTYGSVVNFPVPPAELPNGLFTGCIDRAA
jgi:starch-binding outer membrane protein, SusD/RagB family